MERILTKEEIAELLSAVRDGQIDTETELGDGPEPGSVSKLNLIRARETTQQGFPELDIVLDTFSRNAGSSMTNELFRAAAVNRDKIDVFEFGPVLQKQGEHAALGIVSLSPLGANGLLVFDSQLAFTIVEILLGGASTSRPLVLKRPLTAIELSVVRSVMNLICLDLQKAFNQMLPLRIDLGRLEVDPRKVTIAAPDTQVVELTFTVTVEDIPGNMTIVLPLFAMEPIKAQIKEGLALLAKPRANTWTSTLSRELLQIGTTLKVEAAPITMTIRQILGMKKGDVISLESDPNMPLRVMVEDRPKFYALEGTISGKKAVQITSKFAKEKSHGE